MQLETLVACYYGEITLATEARPNWKRRFLKVYHNNVDITGRLRSIRHRKLVYGNFVNGELIGFIVTPEGIAELTLHPEALDG